MDRKINDKQLKKERNSRLIKIGSSLVLVVAAFMFVGSIMKPSVRRSEILTTKVDKGDVLLTVTAMGKVVPAFEEVINSPITSKIMDVYKYSGDSVSKGEAILKLDLESVEVELKKLRDERSMKKLQYQQLKLSNKSKISELTMNFEIQLVRQNQLVEQLNNDIYLDSIGSGTPSNVRKSRIEVELAAKELDYKKSELENQKALLKSDEEIAKLELEILQRTIVQNEKLLNESQILSPRTSVLSFVNSQVGEQVAAGTKIAMLTDVSMFKIEAEISNNSAHKLKIGNEVIAVIDDEHLKGVISNLNPVAVDNTITFTVQLENNKNKLLRSGINCDLYIIESRIANTLRMFNINYYEGEGTYDVFIVKDNVLKRKTIRLGNSNFEYVVIESGLDEGEEVVLTDLGTKKTKDEIRLNN